MKLRTDGRTDDSARRAHVVTGEAHRKDAHMKRQMVGTCEETQAGNYRTILDNYRTTIGQPEFSQRRLRDIETLDGILSLCRIAPCSRLLSDAACPQEHLQAS